MKVMEIEQYVDELRLPLNPTQLERLKRMNRSIKARCQRIKQAWREHNPNVDRTDADIIKLLGGVVDDNEAEVIENSGGIKRNPTEAQKRNKPEI